MRPADEAETGTPGAPCLDVAPLVVAQLVGFDPDEGSELPLDRRSSLGADHGTKWSRHLGRGFPRSTGLTGRATGCTDASPVAHMTPRPPRAERFEPMIAVGLHGAGGRSRFERDAGLHLSLWRLSFRLLCRRCAWSGSCRADLTICPAKMSHGSTVSRLEAMFRQIPADQCAALVRAIREIFGNQAR